MKKPINGDRMAAFLNGKPFTGIEKCLIQPGLGPRRYYKDGFMHREDGPAYDGHYQEWRIHGTIHRDDGPAQIHGDKYCWWVYGNKYKDIDAWGKALGIHDTDEFTLIKLEWG